MSAFSWGIDISVYMVVACGSWLTSMPNVGLHERDCSYIVP